MLLDDSPTVSRPDRASLIAPQAFSGGADGQPERRLGLHIVAVLEGDDRDTRFSLERAVTGNVECDL